MALGYMLIMFIVFIAVTCFAVLALILTKNKRNKNRIFYFIVFWGIFLAFINATSLPTNYIAQIILAWILGILSVIALVIKLKRPEKVGYAYFLGGLGAVLTLLDLLLL